MNNKGDFVVLLSRKRKVVDALIWGKPDEDLPEEIDSPYKVRADPGGSVTRTVADEPFMSHKSVDGRRFSPGEQLDEEK